MNDRHFNVSIRELKGVPPLTGDTSSYPTPSAFGRFQVLHQIGAGVLGPVFLARNSDRESFAIKVFRLDITPEQASELTAQLSKLARTNLSHPSIVGAVTAGIEGTSCYLVQEYVGADSLDAAIRQYGPAPLPQALRILTSVGAAVDFAAAAAVLHGALHPRDLLVTADEVRLTGFGIANALEAIGLRAPARRPYTAPERIEREAWDTRADVYSVGVLARELLVGRRSGEKDAGRASEEQSALIEPILARATAARREERYGTALEFVGALQQALTGSPIAPGEARKEAVRQKVQRTVTVPRLPLDEEVAAESASAMAASPGQPATEADTGFDKFAELPDDAALPDFTFQHAAEEAPETVDRFAAGVDLATLDADLRADEIGEPETVETRGRFSDVPVIEPEVERAPSRSSGFLTAADVPASRVEAPAFEMQPPVSAPVVSERRQSSRVLPFAAVFLLGILLGVVAGYLWGSSSAKPGPAWPVSPAATEPQPANQAPPSPSATATSPTSTPPAASPTSKPPAPVDQLPAAVPGAAQPGSTQPSGALAKRSEQARPAAAPPTKPAAANGRLVIRSTPRGASVAVNGRSRGVTPLRVGNLAPGRYTVRVSRRGYATEEREVVLSADRPTATLSVAMTRGTRAERTGRAVAFQGTIGVESTPPGAQVFLDGKLVGQTPCTVPNVAAGSHVVRVDRIGFKRWARAIEVRSGQRARVTAALERETQ